MKLKQLFELFIREGMKNDPRGEEAVRTVLSEKKARFEKLSAEDKEYFDSESLSNPYLDSRILNGSGDEEIKSVLVGIDMETQEVLLAKVLSDSGKKIDLVLTHHPEGRAYATFYNVMGMQADILNKFGVPINVAESLTDERMKEVGRRVMPQNHNRAVDAASLLGIPFMSAHTVADNHVASFLQKLFDDKKPKYINEAVKLLLQIPEYKDSAKIGAGPDIVSGTGESRCGKIFVDMTGGTEGHKDLLQKLSEAGVGTVIGMHMSEDHLKEAKKHRINVIIAGHIASDNLGLNLLFDAAEKEFGKIEFVGTSGFRRHTRKK